MIQILRMDASYLTHQLLIFISFLKSPELVEFNFSENELSQVRHPPHPQLRLKYHPQNLAHL